MSRYIYVSMYHIHGSGNSTCPLAPSGVWGSKRAAAARLLPLACVDISVLVGSASYLPAAGSHPNRGQAHRTWRRET